MAKYKFNKGDLVIRTESSTAPGCEVGTRGRILHSLYTNDQYRIVDVLTEDGVYTEWAIGNFKVVANAIKIDFSEYLAENSEPEEEPEARERYYVHYTSYAHDHNKALYKVCDSFADDYEVFVTESEAEALQKAHQFNNPSKEITNMNTYNNHYGAAVITQAFVSEDNISITMTQKVEKTIDLPKWIVLAIQGQKINAIKELRAVTSTTHDDGGQSFLGLRECKLIVETIRA